MRPLLERVRRIRSARYSAAINCPGSVSYTHLDVYKRQSQKLAGFIRDSLLNAGYSRVMLGHFNFQRQYVQASISIQVGSRKNPTSWIHHFNDIALPYILEQITSKLPAYMICHEKLLKLKYQDEETDSQLYETRCV